MYNGIGLPTARGSGTNGYVQRNLSFIRKHKEKVNYKTEEEIKKLDAVTYRPPNPEILDHERKRKVEVKCLELEEVMEKQGYTPEEIEKRIATFREMLMEKENDKCGIIRDEFGRPIIKESHQAAEAQQEKNNRLRAALGIPASFVDGSSLDHNRHNKQTMLLSDSQDNVENLAEVENINTHKKRKKSHDTHNKRTHSASPDHEKKKKKRGKRKERKVTKNAHQKSKKKSKKRKHSSSSADSSSSSSESESSCAAKNFKSRKKSLFAVECCSSMNKNKDFPSADNNNEIINLSSSSSESCKSKASILNCVQNISKDVSCKEAFVPVSLSKQAESFATFPSGSSRSSLSYSPVDRHPELYQDIIGSSDFKLELPRQYVSNVTSRLFSDSCHSSDNCTVSSDNTLTSLSDRSSKSIRRKHSRKTYQVKKKFSRNKKKSSHPYRVRKRSYSTSIDSSLSHHSSHSYKRRRNCSRSRKCGMSKSHKIYKKYRECCPNKKKRYNSTNSDTTSQSHSCISSSPGSYKSSPRIRSCKSSRNRSYSRSWTRSKSRSYDSTSFSSERSRSSIYSNHLSRRLRSSSSRSRSYNRSTSKSCSSCSSRIRRSVSSLPRYRGSPSWREKRRITSARKRPIPYHRPTPSSSSSVSSWIRSPFL